MAGNKFSDEQKGAIIARLELGHSAWAIKQHFKKLNLTISKSYIYELMNNKKKKKKKKTKTRPVGRPPTLTKTRLNGLRKRVMVDNPPTTRTLASTLNISQTNVRYNIKKLGLKKVMKPRCHYIPTSSVAKRAARAYGLYKKLNKGQWKNYITSDEAWFYVQGGNEKRDIQYIPVEDKRETATPFEHRGHPQGVMVWAAISHHGVSKPIFVEAGAKINRQYYIEKVLKVFKKDLDRLYPEGNFTFHQDSAPSHTAKDTIDWLHENKWNFIKPCEWIPNSPDAAPMDFFFWGYVKSKVNKRDISTKKKLKNAIRTELKNIPQELIDNALNSWPKRCLMIYKAKGGNIENI